MSYPLRDGDVVLHRCSNGWTAARIDHDGVAADEAVFPDAAGGLSAAVMWGVGLDSRSSQDAVAEPVDEGDDS